MILTVTLNPAVDKTYETGGLISGQVNRMRSAVSLAGGKGINVSRVLRQFGEPVMAMGFLGGYTGRMIEEKMMREGVECHFTRIAGETRTSTNILADNGYVTEVLEPGPVITKEELDNFLKEYEYCLTRCDIVALCGSAPEGVPGTIYFTLVQKCHEAGRRMILDTSGELLKNGIKAVPYLIKPNRKELEYLTGRRLRSQDEIVAEARKLLDLGIQKIVVSLGEQGLLYIDNEKTVFRKAPEVDVVNTVGCGDSVVASLCMSELSQDEPGEAVSKATALSAANATTRESGNVPLDTYLTLLKQCV